MTESNIGPPPPNVGREGTDVPAARARRARAGWWAAGLAIAVLAGAGTWFARTLRAPEAAAPADTSHEHAIPHDTTGSPLPARDSVITDADLPGFEVADLTNEQRLWLYHRAHLEQCSCGCGMNIAQCRVEDPTCPESPGRARELVEEAKKQRPAG